jgi:ATP-dependent DNA helicase DinG
MSVADFFAASGPLGAKFHGYAPRKGQVDMALDIEDALQTGGVVMAEGPTGTGKSLAYLVPAIEWARQQVGRKVVVCTANIALQEQLVSKDLPLLAETLGGFNFALAKGRNNYLCVDRYHKTASQYATERREQEMDDLVAWADAAVLKGLHASGDVSELPFVPSNKNWHRLSVMSDECKGKPCPYYDECYSYAAKRLLDSAHVIVANYAVVFLNALLRKETGMDLVLPPHQVLVLDEAHKAADIARDHFGAKLRHTHVEWVSQFAKKSGGNLGTLAADVCKASERFFRGLLAYSKSRDYRIRLRAPGSLERLGVKGLIGGLERLGEAYAKIAQGTSDRDDALVLKNGVKNALKYRDTLLAADALEDPDQVFFIEEIEGRGTAELSAKPVRIGPLLKELVFDHTQTTVITSATISVDNNFNYISSELGLEPTHEIVAESPFDWKKNAIFVAPGPDDMPLPNEPTFPSKACSALADIIRQAGGRTLGLFTSKKMLRAAADSIRSAGLPFRILVQGDMPRLQLVEAFKKDETSVLLGTESFWAGVDVPGPSLSCVVMDRMPFPTPDDPVLDALKDLAEGRRDNTFMEYSVPRAITMFKQGSGRLLRSVADRGVIVCLDVRIFTKVYGKKFLHSLPAMTYYQDLTAVGEFLGALPEAANG